MKLQKLILNIILGFLNIFVKMLIIKENQVAFISLESRYFRFRYEAYFIMNFEKKERSCF